MNYKEIFDSKWEQIRQESNHWWSLFSEEDLNKVEKAPIKHDKYVTLLQVKYGYTREVAREAVSQRIAPLQATIPSNVPAKAPVKTKARKTRVKKA